MVFKVHWYKRKDENNFFFLNIFPVYFLFIFVCKKKATSTAVKQNSVAVSTRFKKKFTSLYIDSYSTCLLTYKSCWNYLPSKDFDGLRTSLGPILLNKILTPSPPSKREVFTFRSKITRNKENVFEIGLLSSCLSLYQLTQNTLFVLWVWVWLRTPCLCI